MRAPHSVYYAFLLGATIHKVQVALDAIQRNFNHRIPHELQAQKMADVWLIENIWAIIKQDLDGQDLKNIQDLRAGIRAS